MTRRYVIRRDAAQSKGPRTSKQLADLQERRNALHRLIRNWREVQLVYMPHVAPLLAQTFAADTDLNTASLPAETYAENMLLFLPWSLPSHIRDLPELEPICQLERRLREPQANDALAAIQRHRRIIKGLWQFKDLNASGAGNRPNTKIVTLYKRFDSKTKRAAEEYRRAWRALKTLDPNGSWAIRLKELKDADIRGPGKEAYEELASNSRYAPSWIWLVPRTGTDTNDHEAPNRSEFNDSMRVEWAKAKARMQRWNEELLLVQEEMRRVIEYLRWRAQWWRDRSFTRVHDDATVLSGISGYSFKQAAVCNLIAEQCARYWLPRLKALNITPAWASYFSDLVIPPLRRTPGKRTNEALSSNDGIADSYDGGDDEGDVDSEIETDDELLV